MLPRKILLDLRDMTAVDAATGAKLGPLADVSVQREQPVDVLEVIGPGAVLMTGTIRTRFVVELVQLPSAWEDR